MRNNESQPRVRRVLAIAGSDSSGGAGVQADLKAFARCGVYGMTAITAVTAQNTGEVCAVHAIPSDVVIAQIEAVVRDIGVDAVKTGMLGGVETVEAVALVLRSLPVGVPIVVDPVLAATTGTELLEAEARAAFVELILPLATVATPNLQEACDLLGVARPPNEADAALARAFRGLGPHAVVLTGGHRDRVADIFYDGEQLTEISSVRHLGSATHGSGCTHSAALAAHLAKGSSALDAARLAHAVTADAIGRGLSELGGGGGPVDALGIRT